MGGGTALPKLPIRPIKGEHTESNDNLWGLVDMGSNGIRFSITDLSPPTSRILPTVYQYRNGTSLYDVQYDDDGNQIPIPEDVIQSIIAALLRFQIFCTDFRVPFDQIRIIATEATRKAINSEEYRYKIKQATGLTVEMLPREKEGEMGAWGIASSFPNMAGLVMDLGGGSTQITWLIMDDGHMKTSPKAAFSFPYGAAALTKRLGLIDRNNDKEGAKRERQKLREEMKQNFLKAYNDLEVPDDLARKAKKDGGFDLYLSGGGFRGWGYLLLYLAQKHGHGYPISIINGFTAHKDAFQDTDALEKVAKEANRIFGVSDRRRAQVPAIAFLVNVLAEVIPNGIKEAHFCQGGVREGVFFQQLPPEIRAQGPIETATAPYAHPLAHKIAKLLQSALPHPESSLTQLTTFDSINGWEEIPSPATMRRVPRRITSQLVRSMANMLYAHADMSKELSSTSALYCTSTGSLSFTHGVSHVNRAILALMLEERYEGDLPPREYQYRESLRSLLTPPEIWWIRYIGAVALVLSRIYPAGCREDVEAFSDSDESERESESNFQTSPWSPYSLLRPALKSSKPRKRFRHKKPHLRLSAHFSDHLGDERDEFGVKLNFHLKLRGESREDPLKVQEMLESHIKKIRKVGKEKNWIGNEFDKWGMKVEVDIRVNHPEEFGAGIV